MGDSGSENIGGINVSVSADYSGLQAEFEQIQAQAQDSGEQIASSFEAGGHSVTGLDDAVTGATASFQEFSDAAQSVINEQAELEANAAQAASTLQELYQGFQQGTVSAETLARAQEDLQESLKQLAPAAEEVGHASEEGANGLSELLKAGLELGGIVVGVEALKALAEEALEAYSTTERASVALTAMTGSAQEATEIIEGLKKVALSDALSFPTLVQAEQRMVAFGFSLATIPAALQAAADAAAATGNDFGQVTASMDRIALAGQLTARQLSQLGISTQDVATSMGKSVTDVAAAFKALDESARLQILTESLGKFAGVATSMADTVSGQWQNLKTESEFAFEAIGAVIAPLAEQLLKLASGAVKEVAEAFESLGATFKNVEGTIQPIASGIGTVITAVAALTGALGPLKTAWSGAWSLIGNYNTYTLASKAINGLANEIQLLTGTSPAIKTMGVTIQDTLAHFESLGTTAQSTLDAVAKANAETLKSTAPLSAVVDATDQTQQAYKGAVATLGTLTDAYRTNTTVLNGHIVTLADIATAEKQVEAAAKAAGISVAAMAPPQGPLHEFVPTITAAAAGMDLYSAAAVAAGAKQENLLLGLGMADENLKRAAIAYNAASMSGIGLVEATNALVEALKKDDAAAKAAGVSQEDWNKAVAAAPSIQPQMDASAKSIMAAVGSLDKFEPALTAPVKPAQTLDEAVKALRLSVDDVSGDVGTKMVQAFDTVATSGKATTQLLEAAWGQVSGAVSKLAKTDLPEAVKQQQLYVSALAATDPPAQKLIAAQEALLTDEIALAQERGQSADQYMIDLANLNQDTQILNSTTNILGRTYTSLMDDVNKAFSSLSSNISAGIIQAQSFTKIWQTVWKGFAQEILTTAITAIEDWAAKFLLSSGIVHAATTATTATQTAASAIFVKLKTAETTATTALATAQKVASAALLTQMGAEGSGLAALGTAWDTFDADRIDGIADLQVAQSIANVGAVSGEAAVAGAAGFASVMEDMPYPANVAQAPVIAAAAANQVLDVFGPLASFAGGIDYVPYDMIAQIHEGERIVPASQNTGVSNGPVSVTIQVYADRNPQETARQLARHLTRLSPVFSPLGAG